MYPTLLYFDLIKPIFRPIYPSRSGSNGFVSKFASSAIGSAVGSGIGNYIGNSIFRHNNRNYYYGQENYKPEESGEFMCSLPIEHLKNYTNGICFDKNTKAVYNVPNYNEVYQRAKILPDREEAVAQARG